MLGTIGTLEVSIAAIVVAAVAMNRLRMPPVLGVLLAGVLLGQYSPLRGVSLLGFSFDSILVGDLATIELFATIGAVFLLFQIGLEFSLSKLSQLGVRALIAASIKIGLVFILAFEVSTRLFGLGSGEALFLGVILSMSSTPIITKILESKGLISSREVPLIIAVLILEDIYAVFSLAILSSVVGGGAAKGALILSLVKAVAAFALAYIVLSRLMRAIFEKLCCDDDLFLLISIAFGAGMGIAAEYLGMSASVGAFLAGSIIAGLPQGKGTERQMRSFNILFSSLFFFSIGMLVDISSIAAHLPLALALLLLAIIGKFAGSSAAAYFSGVPGKGAIFIGLSMLTLSEISLLVAKKGVELKVVDPSILSISSAVLFLSVLMSALLIGKEKGIYGLLRSLTPSNLLNASRKVRSGVNEFILITNSANFEMKVRLARTVRIERRKVRSLAAGELKSAFPYLALALLAAFSAFLMQELGVPADYANYMTAASALIALACIYKMAVHAKRLSDIVLSTVFAEEGDKGVLFIKDIAIAVLFILFGLSSPLLEDRLSVPYLSLALFIFSIAVAFLYLRDASKKVPRIHKLQ